MKNRIPNQAQRQSPLSPVTSDENTIRPAGGEGRGEGAISSSQRTGVTLAEVLVSTLIVGFLMVAALNSVGSIFKARTVTSNRNNAYLLAEDLMSEIEQTPYDDPEGGTGIGIDGGETASDRATFDDVDDFDGWSQSPPKNRDGTTITGTTGWTRTVTVEYVDTANPGTSTITDFGLKRVTVTVTGPNSQTVTLTALRSNAGMNELKSPLDRTYITHGNAKLKLGNGNHRQSGAAVSNHAQDSP